MVKAHASKETFWNNERVKRGWSFKYIARKTGIPQTTLGYWFSGAKSPRNARHIQQLCELFDIPYDKGYNEFYHEERKWDSTRKTQHVYKTFWNELREKNNLSLEDISEMTGIRVAVISTNFSGRNIPRRPALEKYCKLFDISLEQGKEEFQKAHEQYLALTSDSYEIKIPEEAETKEVKSGNTNQPSNIDYTFWPSLFANAKFSCKDVAIYLNVEESKVAKYFTGEVVPNFNQIRMLCGLYGGVDITTGSNAFNLLHEHYLTEPQITTSSESTSPLVINTDDLIFEVLKFFYNEASFEEFMELQRLINIKDESALEKIYGIVPHKTYKALENYIG